ncbi:DUF4124 domain-containing protein [Thermochromatium tepidum]|jgi:hypothetical protein|uniref:DUF4124 domain-containing protein n=1 Tax=Thermochromatium tepidum ATCC 43061 TaxID=316276 RepID=A0A6I6EGF6_THETI|nr:DUF4124 domain-containing protein [Thermochromatium tepidum]QGU33290.1 DUF4124 domain-containing protein [Thermochromatium tepidum ATCC 43061]
MLNAAPILVLLLFCAPSSAAVYRWLDTEGKVYYSDRRVSNADRLNVESGSVTEAKPAQLGPSSPDEPYLGPYTALEILAPGEQTTLSESGIPLSLRLDPALIEGHRLLLLVDDQALPVEATQTQFRLTGLGAGTHRLQLQIRGADDRSVAQSAPTTFRVSEPRAPGQLP